MTDRPSSASMQDPVPGARDQADVAEFIKILIDEEFDDRTGRRYRGWQWVGDVYHGHRRSPPTFAHDAS
jgi:hypothetical protein